jgi:hypothetical protein
MANQSEPKLDRPILVRLSEDEHLQLADAAQAIGIAERETVSMSGLLRRALLEFLDNHIEFRHGHGDAGVDAIVRTGDEVVLVQVKAHTPRRRSPRSS